MTTTGQFLVANSTLPSGTALQHLLALRIGAGTGQTVFASQFTVAIEEPRVEMTLKPKKVEHATPALRPAVSDARKEAADLFCTVEGQELFALVDGGELFALVRPVTTIAATLFDETRYIINVPTKA